MHPLLELPFVLPFASTLLPSFLSLSLSLSLARFTRSVHLSPSPTARHCLAVTLLNERIASSYRRERIWKE